MHNKSQNPVVKAQMMIRKPVTEVFQSLIDPAITSHFWFSKGAAPLEVGKKIRWDWEMYGASTSVLVKAIEPHERILIEWDGYSGRTLVEWKFSARADATTFVVIEESGWTGDGDELVKYVGDSTQGFTWTLAGLKAFLEYGIKLNLVADKNPDAHKPGWRPA